MVLRWESIVFDDNTMRDEQGCDSCGCPIGDVGEAFYRPRLRTIDSGDWRVLSEMFGGFESLDECWFCASCQALIDEKFSESREL